MVGLESKERYESEIKEWRKEKKVRKMNIVKVDDREKKREKIVDIG